MKTNSLIILALFAIAAGSCGQTAKKQPATAQYGGIYAYGDISEDSETPNGTAYIYPENDSTALFYVYVHKGAPSYNNGSIDGRITIRDGKAVFRKLIIWGEEHECVLYFEFGENALTISEDDKQCECGFGNGVFIRHTFQRTSAKIPQYYTTIYNEKVYFSEWTDEPDMEIFETSNDEENDFKPDAYEFTGRVGAIYQPRSYREFTEHSFASVDSMLGLFADNGQYYFKPEKLVLEKGYDECSGDSVLAILSEAKFLFGGFQDYNKNRMKAVVDSYKDDYVLVFPSKKVEFDFAKVHYELSAHGKKINGDDESYLNDYSLVFSNGKTRQILVKMPVIEHTSAIILFVGDLDGDGKPDLIIDAPSNYENSDILLFLSSTAQNGELVHCEARTFSWFDC